jgi:hypothetical protein
MVSPIEPVSIALDPDDGPRVASASLLARFLMRELESSESINDLLALFDAPQQSVARRLAVRAADNPIDALTSFMGQGRNAFSPNQSRNVLIND